MKNLVEKPKPEEHGLRLLVLRVLNARISVPSWMLALSSAGLAWIAAFLLLFGTIGLGPFGVALPFSGNLWVPLLLLGTNATVYGMVRRKANRALEWGSFLSFIMWVFGGVAFLGSGQAVTFFVVVCPWLIFYAYIYLASHFRDETGL